MFSLEQCIFAELPAALHAVIDGSDCAVRGRWANGGEWVQAAGHLLSSLQVISGVTVASVRRPPIAPSSE